MDFYHRWTQLLNTLRKNSPFHPVLYRHFHVIYITRINALEDCSSSDRTDGSQKALYAAGHDWGLTTNPMKIIRVVPTSVSSCALLGWNFFNTFVRPLVPIGFFNLLERLRCRCLFTVWDWSRPLRRMSPWSSLKTVILRFVCWSLAFDSNI